jgi:Transposase DDE domain group 1
VVAKLEWHQGELYPRVGFIVTNLKRPAERVSKFYNGRGTAEQWIKEGKQALRWTRLSCRAFRGNAVRLQLFALAYNLANFLRSLGAPTEPTWGMPDYYTAARVVVTPTRRETYGKRIGRQGCRRDRGCVGHRIG